LEVNRTFAKSGGVLKRRLNQAAVVPKFSLETLSRKLKSSHLYLGRGFIWHQPHAQKAFEILKGPLAELVETKQASLGAVWIHGIGAKEEEEIYFPIAHSEGHTLILGTTGAGKTTLFRLLIAQAILRGESVLIIDPKGDREMLEIAKETSKMVGRAFIRPTPRKAFASILYTVSVEPASLPVVWQR
jgi:conjugal transfer pilus assembly protein TraD